jgi:hypothetical protein
MEKKNKEKNSPGFTLIELVVIAAIISLISTLLLANYRAGEKRFLLQSSSHKLPQDLRRAQEMTMSMYEFPDCPPGTKLIGYGIDFINDAESYSLKARCGDDPIAPFEDEIVETISLERGVKIKESRKDGVVSPSGVNVFFYPPDPETDLEGANTVTITLCLKNDPNLTKTVMVNKVGLITLE